MATTPNDEEIKILKEQNTELVLKVQHWKMLAGQRENEKLDLMKELNEMRLKLARLRSNGDVLASKLDTALQSASEKALSNLVRASTEIARTIDLTKAYMTERSEVDTISPRWSAIGGTPKTEKIHRVPPMMIGGQSIQPVVSLSRTLLNTSNPRPTASPNQNRNVTERAVPMHMLQDVYIPLTRIDAGEFHAQRMETEPEANNSDDSTEELDESEEGSEVAESRRMSEDEYNSSRRLDAVAEDMEPEGEGETPPRNSRTANPLEGPSWLLDKTSTSSRKTAAASRSNLEPDSTTEVEETQEISAPVNVNTRDEANENTPGRGAREFSPTLRRRKRPSSPAPGSSPVLTPRRNSQYSSRPTNTRRNSSSGRVLKVMVAKMRLESPPSPSLNTSPCISPSLSPTPAKRLATEVELLDAPSPNGATMSGVIVSEATQNLFGGGSGEPHVTRDRHSNRNRTARANTVTQHDIHTLDDSGDRTCRRNRSRPENSRHRSGSQESRDSDSGSGTEMNSSGRSRRARNKVLNYQERSLRGKLRR